MAPISNTLTIGSRETRKSGAGFVVIFSFRRAAFAVA